MDLKDEAALFIAGGHPRELADLLNKCVADGTLQALATVQRLFESDYRGMTFNCELKALAALTLLRWGEEGLNALMEVALRNPTSKNVSIALDLLSIVTTGANTAPLGTDWVRQDGGKAILQNIDPDLRHVAGLRLSELMLALPDDELAALSMATALTRLPIGGQEPAKLVFAAFAKRWLAVGEPTLNEFRRLLDEHASEEGRFQQFFELYPQILDPMALEVWPRPDLHGFKEPDFVIRRSDDTYLVVEIETPSKRIITSGRQLTAEATQAVSQVTQYRQFLIERIQEIRLHLPEFREPDCMVVIGMEGDLTKEQRAALAADNESRSWLRVVGFDWLLGRTAAITANTVNRSALVRTLRMV